MSPNRSNPDLAARWTSHLIVGFAAGAAVRKKATPAEALISAVVAAVAHELLDAPVADLLSELGV